MSVDRELVQLGRTLDVPAVPDLAARIRGELEPPPRLRTSRRWALAAAVALAAVLVATLAIPDARSALTRLFRIGGERIELVDTLPAITLQLDLDLALGERVGLEEARDRAGFELLELPEAPDRAYVEPRGTVWFLYGAPQRPRLLVAQTPRSSFEPELVKKVLTNETFVWATEVRGSPALFVSGEPHLVVLLDARGRLVRESARLARDVLVWERDGITYRLEGELTLEEAVRIAEALR